MMFIDKKKRKERFLLNSTLQRDFYAPYLRIYIRRKKRDINERPGIDLCAVSTRECSLIQTSHLSLVLRPFARTFCHPSCRRAAC